MNVRPKHRDTSHTTAVVGADPRVCPSPVSPRYLLRGHPGIAAALGRTDGHPSADPLTLINLCASVPLCFRHSPARHARAGIAAALGRTDGDPSADPPTLIN